jgi:hypothetical protein
MSAALDRDAPRANRWKGLRNLCFVSAQPMLKQDRQPLSAVEDGKAGIAAHESCRSAH